MVRPVGHPLRRRAVTIYDLREEFLARCQARNLNERTIQWVRGPEPAVRGVVRLAGDRPRG
jgi:hypothetical protein